MLKPSQLKPGQVIEITGLRDIRAEFVRRYPKDRHHKAINVLRFATLGECQMPDRDLKRLGRLVN